ncbi:MAG: NADH:ubiquinone reductase (Na(+)-transporting) subunit D [Bacteroidales bacterium]|nr:NADH:ubiquinone reductase (Na(+)-transporting) subunit D [Bacteroidales bacterium]
MANEKESLFSKKNLQLLTGPLGSQNPITVQVLGICSALAVTAKVESAIVMALAVTIVVGVANMAISLLRNSIPNRIRIIVQLMVVATLVILVDQILKAFSYGVSKQLSVYVGLIITNCIVMGRMEAFGLGNKPWPSFLDGIGNGLGYGMILVIIAVVRELFGAGTITLPAIGELRIIPEAFYTACGYENCGFMLMPPMALIIVAVIIWIQRSRNKDLIKK